MAANFLHPKHLLSELQKKPNKLLGQSFLHDSRALERVVQAANLSKKDAVLEIGPGLGSLTRLLAERAGKVIAVEKDPDLASILQKELGSRRNLEIMQGDILKTKLSLPQKYKVVANIPYYITSPVMRLFLEREERPELLVLMVQKEVAQRIIAKPPDMNLLAVSVQIYGVPEIVSYVSKACFWPQPKVDSAILRITPKGMDANFNAKQFFTIARAGFKQPRKQVGNNLAAGLKKTKKEIKAWLQTKGISYANRPETLSLQDWLRLSSTVSQLPASL